LNAGTGGGWRKAVYNTPVRAFLREREPYCVSACARIMKSNWFMDDLWAFRGADGVSGLLFHSQRSLFPVFNQNEHPPFPDFMERFLKKTSIHAVQGLRTDAETLQNLIGCFGIQPKQVIEYDLMALEHAPPPDDADPPTLTLRQPLINDMDRLYRLQAAYEQEEVLPQGVAFNPAACRQNLEHITAHEKMLIACIGPRIVGKINTSAASFSRFQIGGVFVHPEYRRRGIGSAMTRAFVRLLCAEGRGVTLFVKKRNAAARAVYTRTGFTMLADYRISYY
jgi:predicted GNAT family acetyltransferase